MKTKNSLLVRLLIISLLLTSCANNTGSSSAMTEPDSAILDSQDDADEKEKLDMLNKESDHFLLYYFEEDENAIEDIVSVLENNYERVTSTLQTTLSSKTEVRIYPYLEAFHNASDLKDAPNWVVGRFYNNSIRIVSPNNPGPRHSYESIIAVVVHEFVHLVSAQINRNVPAFMSEGLASYMAGQDSGVKRYISRIMSSSIPTLAELSSLASEDVYTPGYAFIEYIVDVYGYDGLLKLYKTPDIQLSLNVSEEELYENWSEYLKASELS